MPDTFKGVTLNKERAEQFKKFLREMDIYFEPSECGVNTHIEFRTEMTYEVTMQLFEGWLTVQKLLGSIEVFK